VPHARAAVSSLLADITDPRDPRRIRHPLVAVPGVAVAATLAGAASYRELGSAAAGLPRELPSLPGARWDLAGLVFIAPSAGTLRRVLIALDAGEPGRAAGAWLREHADCYADGWAIALDGKNLRGSRDDDGRLVLFSAMTHRTGRQDAVVPGQITVPEGTTETTQVRTLLGEMNIAEALVTADAAHTCAGTARYLAGDCHADYLLTIKGTGRRCTPRPPPQAAIWSPPNPAKSPKNAGTAGSTAGPPGPPTPTPRPGRASACRTPPACRSYAATSPTWPDSRSARRSCSWPPAAPA